MQTSSLAFETSTPQMVFFTVTCLVRAIALQATVRSYVTWRRSQGSPTVDAGGAAGDIATRFGRWPPAKALIASIAQIRSDADTRGLSPRKEIPNSARIASAERTPHPALRATFSHKGRREEGHAASMRRKPFHTAVAAPEVSTGRIRSSW